MAQASYGKDAHQPTNSVKPLKEKALIPTRENYPQASYFLHPLLTPDGWGTAPFTHWLLQTFNSSMQHWHVSQTKLHKTIHNTVLILRLLNQFFLQLVTGYVQTVLKQVVEKFTLSVHKIKIHDSVPLSHSINVALENTALQDKLERMWANAQRDGCPVEYRWRPLFNAPKFG